MRTWEAPDPDFEQMVRAVVLGMPAAVESESEILCATALHHAER